MPPHLAFSEDQHFIKASVFLIFEFSALKRDARSQASPFSIDTPQAANRPMQSSAGDAKKENAGRV